MARLAPRQAEDERPGDARYASRDTSVSSGDSVSVV